MALQQDISPFNSEVMDTLVAAKDREWVPTGENAWIKVLWTGSESGRWAALFRWNKGYVAGAHKHLSAAHTFVLKGRLEIRSGILEAPALMGLVACLVAIYTGWLQQQPLYWVNLLPAAAFVAFTAATVPAPGDV